MGAKDLFPSNEVWIWFIFCCVVCLFTKNFTFCALLNPSALLGDFSGAYLWRQWLIPAWYHPGESLPGDKGVPNTAVPTWPHGAFLNSLVLPNQHGFLCQLMILEFIGYVHCPHPGGSNLGKVTRLIETEEIT